MLYLPLTLALIGLSGQVWFFEKEEYRRYSAWYGTAFDDTIIMYVKRVLCIKFSTIQVFTIHWESLLKVGCDIPKHPICIWNLRYGKFQQSNIVLISCLESHGCYIKFSTIQVFTIHWESLLKVGCDIPKHPICIWNLRYGKFQQSNMVLISCLESHGCYIAGHTPYASPQHYLHARQIHVTISPSTVL